jgi:hypothetical protein
MSDVQIHWFSIINSLVVVFFLSGKEEVWSGLRLLWEQQCCCFGLWRPAVWYVDTSFSEKDIVSIFRPGETYCLSSEDGARYVSPKCWYLPMRLQVITTQNNSIFRNYDDRCHWLKLWLISDFVCVGVHVHDIFSCRFPFPESFQT